jgi:phage baseplate assembly protein V
MRPSEDSRSLGDLIRFGTIASVDLAGARCTVQAGDLVTGPIRWIEARSGATRSWSPPTKGEQVLLICCEGEIAAGVALRGIVSDANPAPGDSLRELLQFADGAVTAYDPEAHALEILLPAGSTIRVVADGGLSITGDIKLDGNLKSSGTISADVDVVAAGISGKGHVHGQVKTGTDDSGKPK